MKNSELGFLVKKLRDETQKLKTDKAKLVSLKLLYEVTIDLCPLLGRKSDCN